MAQEEIIFPNNIRKIRLGIGMKMTELTRQAKLSLSAISKIEKGVRRLNQNQLLNVCNILGCKLSDIFIKESDEVADVWQNEIKRRLTTNENGGLKIFGSGIRKIRQTSGKTIANSARDAGMTLSVYHKIEIGQREVYEDEIEPLAKSFNMTSAEMLDKIANMYKSGELNQQINKVKEKLKSVLVPGNPVSDIDLEGGLYGVKLYNSARNKLAPVFGTASKKGIAFKKSDKKMIVVPQDLEAKKGVYAIHLGTTPLFGTIPSSGELFADAEQKPAVGDMALFINAKFGKMEMEDSADAKIAIVEKDSKGKLYGVVPVSNEKVSFETIHKIVMIKLK